MKPSTLIALIVVAVIAAPTLWGIFGPDRRPTEVSETEEQKRRAVGDAFGDNTGPTPAGPDAPTNAANAQELAELDAFFTRLGEALTRRDASTVNDSLDARMMLGAVEQVSGPITPNRREREQLIQALSQQMGQQLAQQSQFMAWVQHDLRKVDLIGDKREEAVVYVRHIDAAGITSKMRWWLAKLDGQWKVYDYEDLDMGLRMSSLMRGGMEAAKTGATWIHSVPQLMAAAEFLMAGQLDQADAAMASVASVPFPPDFDALRHLFIGAIRVAQGDPDAALISYDKAEAANPRMPMLGYVRTEAYVALRDHEKALAQAQAYIDQMGRDADIELLIGQSYYWQDAMPEAAEHFLAALADTPKSTDGVIWLGYAWADEPFEKLQPHLDALDDPLTTWPAIADTWIIDEEPELAKALAAYARTKEATTPVADQIDQWLAEQPEAPAPGEAETPAEPAPAPAP